MLRYADDAVAYRFFRNECIVAGHSGRIVQRGKSLECSEFPDAEVWFLFVPFEALLCSLCLIGAKVEGEKLVEEQKTVQAIRFWLSCLSLFRSMSVFY